MVDRQRRTDNNKQHNKSSNKKAKFDITANVNRSLDADDINCNNNLLTNDEGGTATK